MPNTKYKRFLIKEDRVIVLWLESPVDWEPKRPVVAEAGAPSFQSSFCAIRIAFHKLMKTSEVIIGVIPRSSGLYWIKIFNKKNIPMGPLRHDMVVTAHVLAALVRRTIINAFNALLVPRTQSQYAPFFYYFFFWPMLIWYFRYTARQRWIEQFVKTHSINSDRNLREVHARTIV